jgi:hypothetical protein
MLCVMLAVHATASIAAPSRVPGYRPADEREVILAGVPGGARTLDAGERARARADALQFEHRFHDAERELGRWLARDPTDAQARLMRSQVRIATGNARGALADCAVAAPGLDALTATACNVQARAALGDRRGARQQIAQAIGDAPIDAGSLSWASGIAADLAEKDGDFIAAEHWHRRAIATARGAHFPAVAYAEFLERRAADTGARGPRVAAP